MPFAHFRKPANQLTLGNRAMKKMLLCAVAALTFTALAPVANALETYRISGSQCVALSGFAQLRCFVPVSGDFLAWGSRLGDLTMKTSSTCVTSKKKWIGPGGLIAVDVNDNWDYFGPSLSTAVQTGFSDGMTFDIPSFSSPSVPGSLRYVGVYFPLSGLTRNNSCISSITLYRW